MAKVLIADDDPIFRELMRETPEGHETVMVSSGDQVVASLRDFRAQST
ncbi:MAG: hypothetical protein HY922_11680 [Elusimicrobia bacterium]|nr:hypothetical protein [Elusimicrobiota bacterium]